MLELIENSENQDSLAEIVGATGQIQILLKEVGYSDANLNLENQLNRFSHTIDDLTSQLKENATQYFADENRRSLNKLIILTKIQSLTHKY